MTALIILALGVPLALVAWGMGRAGASVPALVVPAALPMVAVAAWFIATNDRVQVSDRFDAPGLSGILVGAVLALLSSPMWVGGYVMGRKARKGKT